MISWPTGIYLEASVLCSLPLHVMTAEMERLKELSTLLVAPILIPEVSFREWVFKRKENTFEYLYVYINNGT